jgi:sugar (pentulose or hexulose) kinase
MSQQPVIAVFDVGKTNKKLLLFNEAYEVVYEESGQLPETTDEDGFACEDVVALTSWIQNAYAAICKNEAFEIKAVNFSAYGASFVYLDADGKVMPPLYNYLKPFPDALKKQFYTTYGGESLVAKQTASPVLGNLNAGMQLYRLKHQKPAFFASIKTALYLPQYLSYILSNTIQTDITSIGCHTNLWHFQKNNYHKWVKQEGLLEKFAPLKSCKELAAKKHGKAVGSGLHDSSAALIPYLASFTEPFALLSTGTWCITLNPFNHTQLSDYELHNDCLCYLSYEGTPVKASRLFAGYEHEQQVKLLATHFNKPADYYKTVTATAALIKKMQPHAEAAMQQTQQVMVAQSEFGNRKLSGFADYETAYHQLIADIVAQQIRSTNLVLKGTSVKKIFVDGGFSKNSIYMQLMALAYPGIEVYAADVAQATALGAALAVHNHWNTQPFPVNLIRITHYSNQ